MKIALKNSDFKYLYELCNKVFHSTSGYGPKIRNIIVKELKPQYEKAFIKYKDEKVKFKIWEKVKFRYPRGEWIDGIINKIWRRTDGKYLYIVEYEDSAEDYDYDAGREIKNSQVKRTTNTITNKNIKKL